MTETFVRAPIVHADGVYIGLAMDDYVRDRALSASAMKRLISNPPDAWWEHPDNTLHREAKSAPRTLGTLLHCAVLEGLDTYEARYVVRPDKEEGGGLIKTGGDMADWLAGHGLKKSGKVDELRARILDHCATHLPADEHPLFFDELVGGRELITQDDDVYVRLGCAFAHQCFPALLGGGGVSEVSIFWTRDDGIRCKARLDRLFVDSENNYRIGALDLKKFGESPAYGADLEEHVLRQAALYGYDIQAVHNIEAVRQLPRLVGSGALSASAGPLAPDARGQLSALADMASRLGLVNYPDLVFTWLFLHAPGAPTGIAVDFSAVDELGNTDPYWEGAVHKCELAFERFAEFSARFGNTVWVYSGGRVRAAPEKWPSFASRIPL